MAIKPKEQLKSLLRELFQLDKTDLDFGIYRIMNLRAKDTEDFIDNRLSETLKQVTKKLAEKGKKDVKTDVAKVKQDLVDFALANYEEDISEGWAFTRFVEKNREIVPVKKYLEAKEAVKEEVKTNDLETSIYNDLYNFFNRYYEGGDFISKPRAGESKYMIPYNGEEVKFYWANHDQYYIKTGENFRNYVFTNEKTDDASVKVEFRLIDAETAVNNNKESKDRRFIPTEDYFEWDKNERTLTLKFYYKVPDKDEKEKWGDKQNVKKDNKGINENLIFNVLGEQITATKDKPLIDLCSETRTIKRAKKEEEQKTFYYHLNRYTNTNSFDYFIHKDLRSFLKRELDYFLKNEIFDLSFTSDDYSREDAEKLIKNNLLRASAIREIAVKLIDFLAEIEDFQKMLFEKKKFVVQSDYCLTLDQIPDDVFDEIVGYILKDKEQKQIKEWHNLGFIESLEMKVEDFRLDDYLVLDTKFLPAELKFKLLGKIENLDEKCGGLLINSDNFQGLNFLQNKYRNKIEVVYSDPPYNAKSSEIIYKNTYKHSSWVSMMSNRLKLASSLKLKDGAIITAIDENEMVNLYKLLADMFPLWENDCISIVHNPAGVQGDNFSYSHEYAIYSFEKQKNLIGKTERKEESEESFRDWGGTSARSLAKNCFYPIIVEDGEIVGFGDVCPSDFHPGNSNIQKGNQVFVYPIKGDEERKWVFARDSVEDIKDELNVREKADGEIKITRTKTITSYKTVWVDDKYYANIYGSKFLNKMFGKKVFDFPKSIFTVEECIYAVESFRKDSSVCLDFFAGSGTTGHAVLNLNRIDIKKAKDERLKADKLKKIGKRKYILIEMGEYFDTVTKPRVQKAIYATNWKKGKPVRDKKPPIADETQNETDGISHIFGYIKLEQYEDTLNNIEFDEQAEDIKQNLSFAEGIRYILKGGTRDSRALLDIEKLEDPFNYEMDIIRLNERTPTKVDLVTTFNFLLGIDVERYFVETHQDRDYHIVKGEKGLQNYQIIWRNFKGLDQARERDWVQKKDWFDKDAHSYTNSDNAYGADSIEREFKRLMFEDVNY